MALDILTKGTALSSMKKAEAEVETLLKWHQVDKPTEGLIGEKRKRWEKIRDDPTRLPPTYKKWTDSDEQKLSDLKAAEITVQDTALGRLKEMHERELESPARKMTPEEQNTWMQKLQAKQEEENEGDAKAGE